MIRLRTLLASIVAFVITGGALAGGCVLGGLLRVVGYCVDRATNAVRYALLTMLATTLFSPLIPTFGLTLITAKWWFPLVRWAYRSYVYPMSPSYLPSPNQVEHGLNPPGLLKATMAMLVWFYTPAVRSSGFRWLWNKMRPVSAPINDTTLQWTNSQVHRAENGESVEPSHSLAQSLDEGFNTIKSFVDKNHNSFAHNDIRRRDRFMAAASAPSA